LVSQDERQVQLLELETKAQEQLGCLQRMAHTLALRRREAAQALGDKITAVLADLGFKNPVLRIDVQTDTQYHSWGNTRCVFLFAPNVGQPFMPLEKIASSGEAARVMLAIKCILASQDPVPVWVFDEIDANVGGEIAVRVGLCMLQLAQGRQVINVTHLPQVASLAHQHWLVHKTQDDQATEVTFALLTPAGQDRVEELARMLGDRQGVHTLRHAQALLQPSHGV
jgi:DNA repair protein RecN (Recombination protein N)